MDKQFQDCIRRDLGNRKYTQAGVNFILEEIVVSYLIRQRQIEFPRTLVKNDCWRLIAYAGSYLQADLYQHKNQLLSQLDDVNPYGSAHYVIFRKKYFFSIK